MDTKLVKKEQILYTAKQLQDSKEFKARKDLIAALVNETETISKKELRERIKEFSERKVN